MRQKMLLSALVIFLLACFLATQAWSSGLNEEFLDGDPSESLDLKPLQIAMADGAVNGTVAGSTTKLAYHDDDLHFIADIGLGYYKPDWDDGGVQTRFGIGGFLIENVAVGGLLSINDYKHDLILNTVWRTPLEGFLLKASGGYLWGEKDFDFTSGTATEDVSQFSWVIGAELTVANEGSGLGLHSLGASVWGAQANDESDASAYFMIEETDEYIIYRDPLRLSEGELLGISFDTQFSFLENLVGAGSFGYERLEFPYADGSKDKEDSLYTHLSLSWEVIDDFIVKAEWKHGSSEDRYSSTLSSGPYSLNAWYSKGRNGLDDEHTIMLGYTYRFGRSIQKESLAKRSQAVGNQGNDELLQGVLKRPEQMPATFLAKADNTAVTQDATIEKAGLSGGSATVDSNGDIHISVGSGTPVITGVIRNGSAYSYSGIIETSTTDIVVHPALLPEGTATYYISVSAGGAYTIAIETE